MKKIVLDVEGMSCSHCEKAIKEAVSSIEGVLSVDVDLSNKTVGVHYDSSIADIDTIINEIDELGYEVNK